MKPKWKRKRRKARRLEMLASPAGEGWLRALAFLERLQRRMHEALVLPPR